MTNNFEMVQEHEDPEIDPGSMWVQVLDRVSKFMNSATERERESAFFNTHLFLHKACVDFLPNKAGVIVALGLLEYPTDMVADALLVWQGSYDDKSN